MNKILVAGSINMDIVARMEKLPRPGETVFGTDLHYIPGGKGSNQAVAASRLGGSTYLIGKLGRDSFGKDLANFLEGEQINRDFLFWSETHPTGVALINLDQESENSITVVSGSNFQLKEKDLEQVVVEDGCVVVSVFEIPQPTILDLFEKANRVGAKTILNPAPAKPFIDGLLKTVDYLIVNETELAFFSGTDEVTEDLGKIVKNAKDLRMRPDQVIIVTLGSNGAICICDKEAIQVDGIKVDAVDTTGAGDCFTGAFAVAISEQKTIKEALDFANTAASLSVQKLGASTSMPDRAQVDVVLYRAVK